MKRFTPKFAVIVATSVVLLAAVSLAVWFFFLKGSDPDNSSEELPGVESLDKTGAEAVESQLKDVLTIEPFESIKLKPGSNISSVTLEVALELVAPDMRQEVQSRMESIRRIIETTVAGIAWLELRSTEGKLGLKLELIKQINNSLSGASLPGDTLAGGTTLSGESSDSQNTAVQSRNIAGARIRDLFFINLMMQ
ncbi:MAG: flagellar basal body-associated FliL family protein [Desulfobacterium sp.]|jgi:flagellar basal body-associated protein FliL|nr:flagellar basal body-associated FliL family protein [Desulfobacterium sp.]